MLRQQEVYKWLYYQQTTYLPNKEQALVDNINNAEEQFSGLLSFLNFRFRHGFIIVTCRNDTAAAWLREQAPKLKNGSLRN